MILLGGVCVCMAVRKFIIIIIIIIIVIKVTEDNLTCVSYMLMWKNMMVKLYT